MKLSTGLLPSVHPAYVNADHSTYVGVTEVLGYAVRMSGAAVWVVTLTEPHSKDNEHVLMFNTEPKVQHRYVKMPVIEATVPGYEDGHEQHLRKLHNIPDDALVQEHWVGNYELKERVFSWYEITA